MVRAVSATAAQRRIVPAPSVAAAWEPPTATLQRQAHWALATARHVQPVRPRRQLDVPQTPMATSVETVHVRPLPTRRQTRVPIRRQPRHRRVAVALAAVRRAAAPAAVAALAVAVPVAEALVAVVQAAVASADAGN